MSEPVNQCSRPPWDNADGSTKPFHLMAWAHIDRRFGVGFRLHLFKLHLYFRVWPWAVEVNRSEWSKP